MYACSHSIHWDSTTFSLLGLESEGKRHVRKRKVMNITCLFFRPRRAQDRQCVMTVDLQFVGELGQCTKPATSENAVIHGSDILKDTFDIDSAVRLVCHHGYEPTSGSPRRLVCGNNNTWSPGPERFTCQKKSCGHPGELANGHYEFPNGVEFGAVITAVCNTGHFAIGEKQRSCLGDGQWDGGNFVCEVVKCEPPKPIPNGQPRPPVNEMYEYGQAVQYVCNGDNTMLGASDTVHCLENGSWSDVPRCAKVVCIRPDIPNARLVEGGSGPYGYKYTLRYECNVGYKMTSDGEMTCLEHGWSSTPNCEAVECPNPGTTNAIITDRAGGPYGYSAILTYKCQDGHRLVGSTQLKCGSDGQWSSKPPTCQVVECPNPGTTNAIITDGAGGPYGVSAILTYRCQAGHPLVGSPQLTCGSDGQWSSKPPTCQAVGCPQPGTTNATIYEGADGPYVPGAVLEYKCHNEFWHPLVGSPQLKCGSDGQWSSKPPTCQDVSIWKIIGIAVLAVLVLVVVCCIVWWCYTCLSVVLSSPLSLDLVLNQFYSQWAGHWAAIGGIFALCPTER
ncbi:sushi, von Willebrand factor type A, EGF and pentraxin domain-containing protein 1-like isoform X3 [Clupea harengus]|uniref:Sushi, von Willebrand factor type A, EGF and pentraxin domain-containing protein 1-like isoform X3 n=1 Tax=Clupea harengus TaxID=7950 RepID=A0A6P8FDU4_CLUHA|nr:sushi, von Willebrand factor type A, EGF and pentraxin domain-containing protein 1-like isoform X3 [Clupea harengus]